MEDSWAGCGQKHTSACKRIFHDTIESDVLKHCENSTNKTLKKGPRAVGIKKYTVLLMTSFAFLTLTKNARTEEPQATPIIESILERPLREIIVSHTDSNGVLQLYRMKENGSDSRQLTYSQHGCRMPACSSDGEKLVYVQHDGHGLSLRVSNLDGKNSRALRNNGRNLLPSWLPDSKHIV